MQSIAGRAALGVALAVAAIVLFVVLQDSGSGDGGETATTAPGRQGGGDGSGDDKPAPPPIPEIVVRDGAPVGGVRELDVASGERVRFVVRADEDAELHVHGYDVERAVRANVPPRVTFPADLEGGYEIELHSHRTGDIPIAELAVSPG